MPSAGTSFLSSLTKRKKTPEQLVKLAVGCLNELAPVHDDHWVSGEEEEEGHAQVAGKLEGLNLGRSSGGTKDELGASAASARSMSSSMGSMASDHSRPPAPSSTPRQTSSGSDAGAGAGAGPAASGGPGAGGASMQRRPSFLLGLLGKKESSSSSALAAQAGEPGSGGSAGSRPAGISTAGSKGLSVFFSDPGKKAGSNVTATSPHGTGLSHSSFNQTSADEGSVMERLTKRLHQMKLLLYGDGEKETDKEKALELAQHIIGYNMMPLLLDHFTTLPFEARKDASQIFSHMAKHNLGGFADPYIAEEHFSIITQLISGYGHPEVALNCGAMIREAIRHETVARRLLFSDKIWPFFDTYVHLPNFDVASDSFATLKDVLCRHRSVAAEFLEKEYDHVFAKYKTLLSSDNYVTKRMSLKLLGEILLDRTNFNVMMRFISSKENLKTIMLLLRDKSAAIQFEAFHVFKVFVANPKKPPEVSKILVDNKEKLVRYLSHFHADKDDDQFKDEKGLLIATLTKLEYAPAAPAAPASEVGSS